MAADRIKGRFADAGFQLKVLTETGIVSPMRPDRTLKVLSTLLKGGTTPATAARIAAIKHGDKPFIVDEAGSLSFAQVDRRTNSLARAMARFAAVQPAGSTVNWAMMLLLCSE